MKNVLSWILVGVVISVGFFLLRSKPRATSPTSPSPEIEQILALKDTKEQVQALTHLLERVGPVETQEEMLRSGLPFTGETHLLIHTVGNYIYEKYGLDGLSQCREYFLSACYHGFIIKALGDHGIEGVATAIEKCAENGGNIVAVQCAHAAGHGFVAWHDYDLLKALKTCDELGAKVANFGFFNCYDGVFMENLWGVHNGTPSEKRWIKEDDVNYPCDDPRIPEKYLNGCWSNQATRAYQYYRSDLKKTAEFCDAVENPTYQATCYGNFARQIHPLTAGSTEKVFELCSNATGEKWQNECILTNMTSYWSVGDRKIPYEICEKTSEPLKSRCLNQLNGLIEYYK